MHALPVSATTSNAMPRPSYSAFKSRLILSCFLLVALLVALMLWKVFAGVKADRQAAFSQTRSFAHAMSAHVGSQLRVIDLSLAKSANALGSLDASILKSPERARQILALASGASDEGFWIDFVDADGMGVAASNGLRIAGVSYADRTYFLAHRRNSEAGLYVGVPERGRVSGRRVFFISRGVFSTHGDFLGVVVASVDAAAIANVFSDALFQPTLSITLLHKSGLVIARAPLFEKSFAFNLANSDLFRHSKSQPYGTYEGHSMVDGQMRVFSYQAVEDAPLVVAVGIAVDSWKRAIPNDILVAVSALGVIVIALALSGRFALRNFARLGRSDAELRKVNDELRVARDDNARGEKKARMIADSLPALVSYVDARERYVFHNSFYKTILGLDVDAIDGKTVEDALGAEIYALIADPIKAALRGERVSFERSLKFGSFERHLRFEYTPDFDESGSTVGFYTMAIDITDMKNIQNKLSSLATIDGLTGLPNRFQLHERLNHAFARSKRSGAMIACLFLDIDHFKSINDTLGHAAGDEALREFGRRLQTCVRSTDLVARLAGDEFVVALEELRDSALAMSVAEKIIEAMRPPFRVGSTQISVSTSIGLALSTDREEGTDSLLKRADQALYRAKRDGRGRFFLSESGLLPEQGN